MNDFLQGWLVFKTDSASNRVLRGGNYNNSARNCRCGHRNNDNGSNRNNNYGARLLFKELILRFLKGKCTLNQLITYPSLIVDKRLSTSVAGSLSKATEVCEHGELLWRILRG